MMELSMEALQQHLGNMLLERWALEDELQRLRDDREQLMNTYARERRDNEDEPTEEAAEATKAAEATGTPVEDAAPADEAQDAPADTTEGVGPTA